MRHWLVAIAFCALLPMAARADDTSDAAPYGMPMEGSQIFYHALLDQFEGRFGRDDSFRWSGEAWAGTDWNRILLESEGETEGGRIADGQQEVLYARPVSTYFNLEAGLRTDLDSGPGRTWAALGIEGLAPLFFHVAATGFVGDRGRLAARLEGYYDLLVTQRLVLEPQVEMNFYAKPDPARRTGTGLSDVDTGLRLRYEINRKFAPYIGLSYENDFAGTAALAHAAGEHPSRLRFAAGIRAWL